MPTRAPRVFRCQRDTGGITEVWVYPSMHSEFGIAFETRDDSKLFYVDLEDARALSQMLINAIIEKEGKARARND